MEFNNGFRTKPLFVFLLNLINHVKDFILHKGRS
jgi:hypothetical protein